MGPQMLHSGSRLLLCRRLLHAVAREPRAVARRARAAAHTGCVAIHRDIELGQRSGAFRGTASGSDRQSSPGNRHLAWRGASDLHGGVGVFGLARSRLALCTVRMGAIHTRGWAHLGVWHVSQLHGGQLHGGQAELSCRWCSLPLCVRACVHVLVCAHAAVSACRQFSQTWWLQSMTAMGIM